MKKQILSIAILATLPFGAYATDPVGPSSVPSNGTAVVATASAPYQTLTPTNDDRQHIASTAYVKGAYNDAIAAVNKVDSEKQDDLGLTETMGADEFVIRAMDYALEGDNQAKSIAISNTSDKGVTAEGVIVTLSEYNTYLQNAVLSSKQDKLYNGNMAIEGVVSASGIASDVEDAADAVLNGFATISDIVSDMNREGGSGDYLSTFGAVVAAVAVGTESTKGYVDDQLSSKRVKIYTTWDNDTDAATRLVEFATAQ